jgi:hypothetical protein
VSFSLIRYIYSNSLRSKSKNFDDTLLSTNLLPVATHFIFSFHQKEIKSHKCELFAQNNGDIFFFGQRERERENKLLPFFIFYICQASFFLVPNFVIIALSVFILRFPHGRYETGTKKTWCFTSQFCFGPNDVDRARKHDNTINYK